MSSPLLISPANLDVLEKNMQVLSQNINSVTGDIIDINGQISSFNRDVNDIKDSVVSLEEEIKNFMSDIRNNTIVSNAQNDILIKEAELNKKYGSYANIRQLTKGLLDSIKHNFVSKQTLKDQSESILLKAPNYYLSYVLIAISSWFNNNRSKATSALNEALKLDEKKTALLLCFIHLELGREKAATVWLKYYFNVQNAKLLDSSFVFLLDAYASNIFPANMSSIIKKQIDSYINELNYDNDIVTYQVKRWGNFFTTKKEKITDDAFPFIKDFSNSIDSIIKTVSNAKTYYNIYYVFNDAINNSVNMDKSINGVINEMVDSYEDNEYSLKQSIIKNRLIIEFAGDINKANSHSEYALKAYNAQNDLYTIFSNIVLSTSKASINSKRLAISYLKNIIKNAIEESLPLDDDISHSLFISIDKWQGSTTNGSNENDLKADLKAYVYNNQDIDLHKYPIFNIKTLLALFAGLLGVILSISLNFVIGITLIIISLIVSIFFINECLKMRDIIIKKYDGELNDYYFILENILAEVVDVSFMKKRAMDNYDFIVRFLNKFDDSNF